MLGKLCTCKCEEVAANLYFLPCCAGSMAATEAAGAAVNSQDVVLGDKPGPNADAPARSSPGAPVAAGWTLQSNAMR